MKRCSRCGETKSLDAFWQRADTADGYRPECRDCSRQAWARRQGLAEPRPPGRPSRWPGITPDGRLQCHRCGETKPLARMRARSASRSGYDGICLACAGEMFRDWRRRRRAAVVP